MALEKYVKLDKVGEGTYGVVYRARESETDTIVALKRVRFLDEDAGIPTTALREISVLKELSHPNIVACVGGWWVSTITECFTPVYVTAQAQGRHPQCHTAAPGARVD